MEGDEKDRGELLHEPPWIYRGRDVSRVLALSDGVFAFAMTLLVLGLVVPATVTTGGQLQSYLLSSKFFASLFAYVLTFFIIGVWWRSHHRAFNYIQKYDGPLLQRNLVFLIFIAILPFAVEVLNAAGTNPDGVIFFSLTQIAAALTLNSIWSYASGKGHLTAQIPEEWVAYIRFQGLAAAVIFALSIPVALISPTGAEIVWVGVFGAGYLRQKHAVQNEQMQEHISHALGKTRKKE